MLCPLPSTHWLDRLHARANFNAAPATAAVALPNPSPPPPSNTLPAILSDLFAAGPSALASHQNRPRKQPHPRKKQNPQEPHSPRRPATTKSTSGKLKRKKKVKEDAFEAEDGPRRGTEATVIDTSTVGWKSAKVIFRKGGVWKVREKKGPGGLVKKNRRRLGGKLAAERDKERRKEEVKEEEDGEKADTSNQDTSEETDDDLQLLMMRPRNSGSEGKRTLNGLPHDAPRGKKRKISLI